MAAWVILTLSTPQFPEHFLLGLEALPVMRQVIGLVTYCCSVLTSLADIQTDFPPLALQILNDSLLPFWAAGTDTTGCHYQGRSWLSQEAVALLGKAHCQHRQGTRGEALEGCPCSVTSLCPFGAGDLCVSSPPLLGGGEKKSS